VATLEYQYGRAIVWIDHLAAEREPHSYDLCERHAARLSVPNGWHLDDRRAGRGDDARRLVHASGAHRLAG